MHSGFWEAYTLLALGHPREREVQFFYCHSMATVSLVVRWNGSGSFAIFDAYYMHSSEAWDGISAKFSKSDLGYGLK